MALSIEIKVPQAVIFDRPRNGKIKKRRKNDQTGTQAKFAEMTT